MGQLNRVYVELDAILDTRLATIAKISPQAAVDLVKDERYYSRQIDDFEEMCGVSRQAFREAYAKRDADVVRNSIMTTIPHLTKDLIAKLEVQAENSPSMESLAVELNLWPYHFDEVEREALEIAMMSYAGRQTLVYPIFRAPKELTPAYAKQTYSGMIMYNLRQWLEPNLEAFHATKMPRVTVIAPALFHDQVPEPGTFVSDGLRQDLTGFELSELAFAELFALELIDPKYFSIHRPE